ncbi:MAG TPA: ATP-binding cassette domain-containing protein [Fimbriimonadaceae bacterium]|nr:ATP-binding cassette domain-containing protein [Fimbriimonadaceae bacterium]
MISVRGLNMTFGDRPVLRGIDLEVAQGEIVVIMGSSGGGKTTLLRCISGLLRPTSGTIIVDGIDVIKDPEGVHDKVGLVFQSAALFDFLDVQENVVFGVRRRRRLSNAQARSLAEDKLKLVSLDNVVDLMPDQLSGGMQKRVGLARALAMEPTVLLYDEPTSGLDPITAYSIDQLISETRTQLQVTSVVVSHDVNSVFRVADQIAFLDEGRLLFHGTVEEFRASREPEIVDLVTKAQAETLA